MWFSSAEETGAEAIKLHMCVCVYEDRKHIHTAVLKNICRYYVKIMRQKLIIHIQYDTVH